MQKQDQIISSKIDDGGDNADEEDDDMEMDEHLIQKANNLPKYVPWVEKQ